MAMIPNIEPKCTQCGGFELDQGFLRDAGEGSAGDVRYVARPLERGIFGGAKQWGLPQMGMTVYRCRRCGHLEFYALEQI